MEIERKFLVKYKPDNIKKTIEITQYYLSYDPEVRIRSISNNFFYTIKSQSTSLERKEYEIEIDKETFDKFKNEAKSKIYKHRSYINLENNLVAEMDTYLNGLVVVEVEFSDITNANDFIPPTWFGKEVTYDKKYKNVNLAEKI